MEVKNNYSPDSENCVPGSKKPFGEFTNRASTFKRSDKTAASASGEMQKPKKASRKRLESKGTNTEAEIQLKSADCPVCSQTAKKDVISAEEDDIEALLTAETLSDDTSSSNYWKCVTEETRSALADCLAENEALKLKLETEKRDKEAVLERLELAHAKLRAVVAMWKKKFNQELEFDSTDDE